MIGKWIAALILGTALLAGAALYYFQVYHYYQRLPAADVQIALTRQDSGVAEALVLPDLQAIDATSSPIRFRACFTAPLSLTALRETYVPYEAAQPRIAPGWFGCFDAPRLGGDLQAGRAQAFLGVADVAYGIDLVVAVDAQGRGYAWHQINPCGEKVFEGDPAPEGCPVPPAAQ